MSGKVLGERPPQAYEAGPELSSVPAMRARIDSAGRIVVPAEMRRAMLVDADGRVTVSVVDGELRVVSPAAAVRRLQRRTRELVPPGTLVSEELVAERRREAGLER